VAQETAYLRVAIRSCIRMHSAMFEMQKRASRCYTNDTTATEKLRKTHPPRPRKKQCDFPEICTSFGYYHILTKNNKINAIFINFMKFRYIHILKKYTNKKKRKIEGKIFKKL